VATPGEFVRNVFYLTMSLLLPCTIEVAGPLTWGGSQYVSRHVANDLFTVSYARLRVLQSIFLGS